MSTELFAVEKRSADAVKNATHPGACMRRIFQSFSRHFDKFQLS